MPATCAEYVGYRAADAIHLGIGALVFPTGYVILRQTILARVPWAIGGLIWASLIAHPMMAIVIAFVWKMLAEQPKRTYRDSR